MRLWEILPAIEHCQQVCVYEVGKDGFSYQGMANDVPSRLRRLNVESMHAYESEIDILVS